MMKKEDCLSPKCWSLPWLPCARSLEDASCINKAHVLRFLCVCVCAFGQSVVQLSLAPNRFCSSDCRSLDLTTLETEYTIETVSLATAWACAAQGGSRESIVKMNSEGRGARSWPRLDSESASCECSEADLSLETACCCRVGLTPFHDCRLLFLFHHHHHFSRNLPFFISPSPSLFLSFDTFRAPRYTIVRRNPHRIPHRSAMTT